MVGEDFAGFRGLGAALHTTGPSESKLRHSARKRLYFRGDTRIRRAYGRDPRDHVTELLGAPQHLRLARLDRFDRLHRLEASTLPSAREIAREPLAQALTRLGDEHLEAFTREIDPPLALERTTLHRALEAQRRRPDVHATPSRLAIQIEDHRRCARTFTRPNVFPYVTEQDLTRHTCTTSRTAPHGGPRARGAAHVRAARVRGLGCGCVPVGKRVRGRLRQRLGSVSLGSGEPWLRTNPNSRLRRDRARGLVGGHHWAATGLTSPAAKRCIAPERPPGPHSLPVARASRRSSQTSWSASAVS